MTVTFLQTSLSVDAAAFNTAAPRRLSRTTSSSIKLKAATDDSSQQHQQQQLQQQHLVLIGGGHAHVQVIKALNAGARPLHLKVTLIDANNSASYSGMVPGCIAGLYSAADTQLHLEPLAKWADIQFVHDTVVDIDFDGKQIHLLNQEQPVAFDVISMDIGSTSRGLDSCPGASKYAIPTRPIDKLIHRLDRARQEVLECDEDDDNHDTTSTIHKQQPKLVVIGGGAAGIELAMTVTSRWKKDGIAVDSCTVLDAGRQLLPAENSQARETLLKQLNSKKITVQHGCQVTKISKDVVHLAGGDGDTTIPYTHCIWATGAGAHRLSWHLAQVRGLECDEYGWMTVQPTLQSTSHPFVFAAGDCASIQQLEQGPPPKAGVYAVRCGPILIENLTRYLDSIRKNTDPAAAETSELKLLTYVPQDDFLKLLVCGDGTALGFRFGLAFQGKWVFQLKDNIDQSFMKLFDVADLPKPVFNNKEGVYDTSQYDTSALVPDLLEPDEAAALLQRTDDGVDFQQAKLIIRTMGTDASYRSAVLQRIREPKLGVVG